MTAALAVPAAGVGKRFSKDIKKQFYQIDNKPILYFTLKKMLSLYSFDEIIIGINLHDESLVTDIIGSIDAGMPFRFVPGGETRALTVMNCLEAASSEYILVHDAVRPFVSKKIVEDVLSGAKELGAAIPAISVRDTVKKAEGGIIKETVKRDGLYLAHTPQGFKTSLLKHSLRSAIEGGAEITDEASAVEYCGGKVKIVPSSPDNIKITYTEDIETVNILKRRYFN